MPYRLAVMRPPLRSSAPPWPPVALPVHEQLPRPPATPPRSSDSPTRGSSRRRPRARSGRPPAGPRNPTAACLHAAGGSHRRPGPDEAPPRWWRSGRRSRACAPTCAAAARLDQDDRPAPSRPAPAHVEPRFAAFLHASRLQRHRLSESGSCVSSVDCLLAPPRRPTGGPRGPARLAHERARLAQAGEGLGTVAVVGASSETAEVWPARSARTAMQLPSPVRLLGSTWHHQRPHRRGGRRRRSICARRRARSTWPAWLR